MRIEIFAAATLMALMFVPTSAPALEKYDPYPWCAVYGGRGGGATNCGFLTLAQCRATISGMGGFCEPNQFYNPRPGKSSRKKQQY